MHDSQALKTIFILALALNVTCSLADEESQKFYNLGIEDLLKIQVSVASVEEESITETPAIVSRYERIELEKMGINNLRDMFNFVPGVIVQNSITGLGAVQIRGIDETFNQKVLFLLDGVPYHQPSHSLIPLDGIPWESISHIEVIRGPGTVLHGTQASGGVINVITQDNTEQNTLYAQIGSDKLTQASGYITGNFGDENQIYLGGEVRREGGETIQYEAYFPDVGLIIDDVFREQEKESVIFKYTHNNTQLLAHAFSDKNMGINDAYADEQTLQPFITESEAYLVHLNTHWQSDDFFGKFYADYNFYTFDFTIKNLFAPNVDALVKKEGRGSKDYRLRLGTEVNYQFNPQTLWTVGFEHESRSSDRYNLYMLEHPNQALATLIPEDKIEELSVYSQLDITRGQWRYILGGRYIDHELSGSHFSPRLGVVFNYDQFQTIKILYSTGYNSPNPLQTNIFLPGNVVGNQSLTAETVSSFDIAYSYAKSNLLIVANLYKMDAEDFIIRRLSEPLNSVSFFNEGFYTREGAELDFQLVFDELTLFSNLAYVKQGNQRSVSDPDAFRIPKFTFSGGFSYHFFDRHSVGANLSFIDERAGLGAYTVIGLNYTAAFEHFDLVASINNASNKVIKNPNNSSQNSSLAAFGDVDAIYQIGIRFKF